VQVKTKTLIVGGLAVLMVGLLWWRVVYSPITSKTSKANAAAHNAQIDIDNLQKSIDDLQAAAKKSAAKDVGTAKMLVAVPAAAAEASFLRSLDTLRISTGAGWQSVTPGTPTVAGPVTSITVNIIVGGTEDQLARYLSELYSMRRIFIPDNVTLSSNGNALIQTGSPGAAQGALFKGGPIAMTVSGRIFAGPAAVPGSTTSAGTTPATVAPSTPGG
jgi:Tfp pilus assembly protein PilO